MLKFYYDFLYKCLTKKIQADSDEHRQPVHGIVLRINRGGDERSSPGNHCRKKPERNKHHEKSSLLFKPEFKVQRMITLMSKCY